MSPLRACKYLDPIDRKLNDRTPCGVDMKVERVTRRDRFTIWPDHRSTQPNPLAVVRGKHRLRAKLDTDRHLPQEADVHLDGVERASRCIPVGSAQPEEFEEQFIGIGQHLGVRRIVHVPVVVDKAIGDEHCIVDERCCRSHGQMVPRGSRR